jgi:hypothetical protein
MSPITRLLSLLLAAGLSTSALAVEIGVRLPRPSANPARRCLAVSTAMAFRAPISRSCSMAWS